MNSLASCVNASLAIEKLRVASQVRQTHLAKQNRRDENTDQIVEKLTEVERFINGLIAEDIEEHPAYWWFSKVKGIGKENIGKVLGFIRVKPEKGFDKEGNEKDLPYADTISALWEFAGYGVTEKNTAPKRIKGQTLTYCSQLRAMVYRLGTSLLRIGKDGSFYQFYQNKKEYYVERFTKDGYKILPANQIPKEDSKKYGNGKFISEGHIHAMAFRKNE